MWSDKNFKVSNGSSQIEHVNKIKSELNKILKDFYENDYNLILVSHGNSIGIFKNIFNQKFTFEDWKNISMPDMYSVSFDESNKVTQFKRDVEGIEKIFKI